MNINEGYNVKHFGIYSIPCPNCRELTRVQNADGVGLCVSCDYRWEFPENMKAGRCIKCDIPITVGNWLAHDTKIGDPRDHPLYRHQDHPYFGGN